MGFGGGRRGRIFFADCVAAAATLAAAEPGATIGGVVEPADGPLVGVALAVVSAVAEVAAVADGEAVEAVSPAADAEGVASEEEDLVPRIETAIAPAAKIATAIPPMTTPRDRRLIGAFV